MLKSDPQALRLTASLEYGASAALLPLAKDIGLDSALYSRPHCCWLHRKAPEKLRDRSSSHRHEIKNPLEARYNKGKCGG